MKRDTTTRRTMRRVLAVAMVTALAAIATTPAWSPATVSAHAASRPVQGPETP